MKHMTSVVVIGGGPAGYEAALVARQLGAQVVLIERDGIGGSAVLTDCVPSKTLIATADVITRTRESHALGVLINGSESRDATITVNLPTVNARVMELAHAQSDDIEARLIREGVTVLRGLARLTGPQEVAFTAAAGSGDADRRIAADTILIATGARPRTLADALPDTCLRLMNLSTAEGVELLRHRQEFRVGLLNLLCHLHQGQQRVHPRLVTLDHTSKLSR